MQRKLLAAPVYSMALLMIATPLGETLMVALPIRVSQVGWRFGTTGLLSRALMTPLLGVLLALGIALLLEHRAMLRVLMVLSSVGAFVLAGMIGLFLMDGVQMRVQVPMESRSAFDFATLSSALKHGAAVIVLGIFAWSARRGGRGDCAVGERKEAAKPGRGAKRASLLVANLHQSLTTGRRRKSEKRERAYGY